MQWGARRIVWPICRWVCLLPFKIWLKRPKKAASCVPYLKTTRLTITSQPMTLPLISQWRQRQRHNSTNKSKRTIQSSKWNIPIFETTTTVLKRSTISVYVSDEKKTETKKQQMLPLYIHEQVFSLICTSITRLTIETHVFITRV